MPVVPVHGSSFHSRSSFWDPSPSYAGTMATGVALGAGAACCATDRGCLPVAAGIGLILLAVGIAGLATSLFPALGIALLLLGTILAIGALLTTNEHTDAISCCRP